MTGMSVVIRQCTQPYMMEIPVKFKIFPPVPLDSGTPFGLEVNMMYYIKYWAYCVRC